MLPEYFRYIQGVVDSEDLPLNISRESVQSSRVMTQLKKVLTAKLIDTLKTMGKDNSEGYEKFWKVYGRSIKEGIASDPDNFEALTALLRFHTVSQPQKWSSLEDYVLAMKPGQKKIFYILGDDERSVLHSPHLEAFRQQDHDVISMTDPLDPFMLLRLNKFQDFEFANVASEVPETTEAPKDGEEENKPENLNPDAVQSILDRFKTQLGDRLSDIKSTDRLVSSPARLVDPQGTMNPELQRVYRMLNKEYDAPQKVLEINPNHPIIQKFSSLPADSPLNALIIEQVYEDALTD